MADKLTRKQKKAADEYLKDMNQTRAYVAAGYSANGAKSGAARLFANVNVKAYIDTELNKHADNCGLSVQWVLKRLKRLADFDARKLYDADGRAKPIIELDDDTAAAITGFETAHKVVGDEQDGCVVFTKVKFADPGQNLERIGRHLKMFTDKAEVTGLNGAPIEIAVSFVSNK